MTKNMAGVAMLAIDHQKQLERAQDWSEFMCEFLLPPGHLICSMIFLLLIYLFNDMASCGGPA